jgi:hypothetical protein
VALSYAIAESSKILANSEPIPFDKSFKIFFGGTLLAIGVGFYKTMGKMTPVQLVTGGLAVVGIAGVIAVSSQLLALGTYKDGEYPGLKWALGVGLSLGAFGTATYLLEHCINWRWIRCGCFISRCCAVLLVAGTISTTSHILGTVNMVCLLVTNGH